MLSILPILSRSCALGQPDSTATETISEGLPSSSQPPNSPPAQQPNSAGASGRARAGQGHTDLARRERERLASAISIRSQGPADVTSMSPARDGAPSRPRKGWPAQWPGGKRAPAPATRSRSKSINQSVQSRDPPIGCNPVRPMGAPASPLGGEGSIEQERDDHSFFDFSLIFFFLWAQTPMADPLYLVPSAPPPTNAPMPARPRISSRRC